MPRRNVTDAVAVEKCIAEIVAKNGRLDILVNTVGGYAGGKNLWESDARTYDKIFKSIRENLLNA